MNSRTKWDEIPTITHLFEARAMVSAFGAKPFISYLKKRWAISELSLGAGGRRCLRSDRDSSFERPWIREVPESRSDAEGGLNGVFVRIKSGSLLEKESDRRALDLPAQR